MSLIQTPASIVSGTSSIVKGPVGSLTNFLRNPFSRSVKRPDFLTPDYPEGFWIDEIAPKENDGVQIRLMGNMMIKDRFDREVSLRVQKDFYPGSDDPVAHILGIEENDITIKGRLYDKRYSDPAYRGVAGQIRDAFEEMTKRKNVVKISLGEFRRYALITKCRTSEKTLADIDYEITFMILGRRVPQNYQLIDRLEDIPVEINSDLIQAAFEFQETYSTIPDSVPASIADILNDAVSSVAGAVKIVTDFVDGVVSSGEEIANSINRAVGIVRYARGKVITYKRRVGAISYSLQLAGVSVPTRFTNSSFIGRSMSDALTLQQILTQLLKRFEALRKTVPIARHRVIVGDTLQKISITFYGSADNWKKIYDHNKLSTTELARGSVLEIPRL